MKVFYTDHFVLPLPDGHRFPMRKYSMLREAVQAFAPQTLEEAPAARDDELLLAHDAAYVARMSNGTLTANEVRQIGFPWSPGMAERARRSAGATIAAARASLRDRCGINLAGGTHHAFAHHGEGFCCYNDAAVATRVLQRDCAIGRVLICDLDVHQGNGTARIFAGDASVFTFSMHGERNYPVRKIASCLDVGLPDRTADDAYLEALRAALDALSAKRRWDIVFFNAGVDPHRDDRLGRLALSDEGLREREKTVIGHFRERGVPVCGVIGGGYSTDVPALAARHAILFETAAQFA